MIWWDDKTYLFQWQIKWQEWRKRKQKIKCQLFVLVQKINEKLYSYLNIYEKKKIEMHFINFTNIRVK